MSRSLKVKQISKNDEYLGTPVLFDRKRANSFEPLFTKCYASLQGWKAKLLSKAGRTVLLKSVLSANPIYQMQCLAFPKTTLDNIEKMQRELWWNKKDYSKGIYTKAWVSFCSSIDCGGLGIRNPHKKNISMLTNLAWRLLNNPNLLWVKILKHKYFSKSNPMFNSIKYKLSWI